MESTPAIRIRDWEFCPPSPRLALGQLVVASCDWLLVATVFYVLLPASAAGTAASFRISCSKRALRHSTRSEERCHKV